MAELVTKMPLTYLSAKKKLMENEKYTRYVVCPKCNAIYDYESCIVTIPNRCAKPKVCKHIEFPDHPRASQRTPCNTELLKPVKKKGKVVYRPRKIYCYQHLYDAVKRLIYRDGFLQRTEHWRNRTSSTDMSDIYDAAIWQEFQTLNNEPFLNSPFNFAFSLNCDWFQPYKHISDSVGTLYMVILNLPREERYKPENIILCGIIPGPSEPKLTINSFLAPLVNDLESFEKGVDYNVQGNMITIKAALILTSSDIPATRKLCGFISHSADLACSKCLASFKKKGFPDCNDYALKKREKTTHMEHAKLYLKASTKAQQKELSSEYGLRYSVLLKLKYFDVVRMHVIDPMHNLLLGTAKHVMEVWTAKGILDKHDLKQIEAAAAKIIIPSSVGRIPRKIASTFSGFTADQWRSWCIILSPVVLKPILHAEHYRCWMLFVRGCSTICSKIITTQKVNEAHEYFKQFIKMFKSLYGSESCTVNMHLHLHLKECITDYGPVYTFWCFAFERFNGILGDFHTNNNSIEAQLMTKFLQRQNPLIEQVPETYHHLFANIAHQCLGSLQQSMIDDYKTTILPLLRQPMHCQMNMKAGNISELLKPIHNRMLTSDETQQLKMLYENMYPNVQIGTVSMFMYTSTRANFYGKVYSSNCARSEKSKVIAAYWPRESPLVIDASKLSIGEVQYFLQHTVQFSCGNTSKMHKFAFVKWYEQHSQEKWFGKSAIIAKKSTVHPSPCSFLPIERIYSVCAFGELKLSFHPLLEENVIVAIPLTTY